MNLPGAGFADVGGGPHATAIDCVAWWEVAHGDGHGSYRPAADVRRDQIATMLARVECNPKWEPHSGRTCRDPKR